ncbi:conserved phage C-terminal domain-containing protein [uncultured Anaerococcus sp.]|uniref:conserved phage C-terminal domain-containing protein n=1 Tax=uncultured Anaerococcus sp. TaxID=293428 RepID=UPI00288AC8CA|nr:conserved phage C-terminal domain-containing protein [uncultured Anaerococcus sp.]
MNEKEKDLKVNEEVEEDKEKDYFYIIPKNVFEDRRLTPSQVMVFAEIYQLSRKKGYCYASNTYLTGKMNMGRMTIIRAISNLKELGYIETKNIFEENSQRVCGREITIIGGIKMKYGGIKKEFGSIKTIQGVVSKSNIGGIKSEPVKNINNKNINNKNNIYSRANEKSDNFIVEVVDYLNKKTNKNFKSTTSKTKSLINARRKEGYTLGDFKQVIDIKTKQWQKDSRMNEYLRPETLFGNKFESYLQQTESNKSSDDSFNNFLASIEARTRKAEL